MAEHLKEVWRTEDGKIFGTEAEATEHEERNLIHDVVRRALLNSGRAGRFDNGVEIPSTTSFLNYLNRAGYKIVRGPKDL